MQFSPYGAKIQTSRMVLLSNNITDNHCLAMTNALQPFHLLVIAVACWLNRQQQVVIDYLIEENRVLKEQVEGQRR
jgi:hypothetical protein